MDGDGRWAWDGAFGGARGLHGCPIPVCSAVGVQSYDRSGGGGRHTERARGHRLRCTLGWYGAPSGPGASAAAGVRALARPVATQRSGDDARALAAGLARDVDAGFERLVERYQHRLYGFVLTLTKNRSDAEEIAQDAFVSAYAALRRYEPERRRSLSLRAWLFTIALNKVRNRARRAPSLPIEDGLDAATREADAPDVLAAQNEAIAVVRRALDELSPRYRTPVVLRHIEGLSYDEIAQVLDQPVGTAKANVHRGLALLRKSHDIGALA